VGGRRRIVWSG